MAQGNLTAERLREVIDYDRLTGAFAWRVSRGKAAIGKPCGKLRASGRVIGIDGENYTAARLAWLYVHGEWPSRVLRFKDGNRDNAAIENLVFSHGKFLTREGRAEYMRNWHAKNPRNTREIFIRARFGISLKEYQRMFVEHGGVCGICKNPETATQKGKPLWLSIDHDHADGSIRGLLCARCNHLLGNAKDNRETLAAAISYLDAHAAKPKSNVVPLAGRKLKSVESA